jgi:hypothetical protein
VALLSLAIETDLDLPDSDVARAAIMTRHQTIVTVGQAATTPSRCSAAPHGWRRSPHALRGLDIEDISARSVPSAACAQERSVLRCLT